MRNPGPIFLRKRGEIWYFRFTGSRDERSTGKRNRIDALGIASDAWKKRVNQEAEKSTAKLGSYANEYFLPGCPLDQARRTAGRVAGEKYVTESRKMLEHYILPDPICQIKLDDLRRKDLLDFQARLVKAKGYSRVSARVMQTIKAILREMHYREEIPRDVVGGIRTMVLPTKRRDRFTGEELSILFKSRPGFFSTERDYDLYLTALFTGMRRGELVTLKWIDLDFTAGIIKVQRALKNASRKESLEGPPKSGKSRITPMIQQAREILLRQANTGEYVFGDFLGRPYPVRRWTVEFTRAMQKAGLTRQGLTPHSFRHTFNSILLSRGIPAEMIRQALGWTGETIQANYTHIGVEEFAKISIEV